MNRLVYVVCILFLCTGALIHAQAPVSKEINHTVEFPKGDAAWSVVFEANASQAMGKKADVNPTATLHRIKRIDFVRVGALRCDSITWMDGHVTQAWRLEGSPFVAFEPEDGGPVKGIKRGYITERQFDVSTFAWVGKDTFAGEKSYKGRKCRYYETTAPGRGYKETVQLFAAIDEETSRPLFSGSDSDVATYIFDLPLPQGQLVMPEKFQKVYKKYADFYASPEK